MSFYAKQIERLKKERAVISVVAWTALGKERQQEAIKAAQEAFPELKKLQPEISREDALIELAWSLGFDSCLLHIESGCLRPARWQCEVSKALQKP